ncbi:S41 family peptidase [soil metagenome]
MKTVRRGRRFFTGSVLATVFLAGLLAGQMIGSGESGIGASSSLVDQPAFATFQQAWDLVHEHYVLPEELDADEMILGAAAGMMEAIGDTRHSTFLDPQDAKSFRSSLRGELIGIGVHLRFDGDVPEVIKAISGSPAEEAGIQAGDLIYSVDGVETDRMTDSSFGNALRGKTGSEVTLDIGRPSDQSLYSVTIARAVIRIDPVEIAFLPENRMLIRLNEFSSGAGEALRESLIEANSRGLAGLVFDLRGNPGGFVSEAIAVASEFMDEGAVIYLHQERGGEPRPVTTVGRDGKGFEFPLVVLIDGDSASAAEIIAASLRDNDRAAVVGMRTFGTGTVISSFDLNDGSVAAIGTALWLTPGGDMVRGFGVEPTVEEALAPGVAPIVFEDGDRLTISRIELAEDAQLIRALELLALSNSEVFEPSAA